MAFCSPKLYYHFIDKGNINTLFLDTTKNVTVTSTMVIYVLISIHLRNWQRPSIIALVAQHLQLLNAELAYKLLSLTWNFTVLIRELGRLSTTKCPTTGLQRQHFQPSPRPTHPVLSCHFFLLPKSNCWKETLYFGVWQYSLTSKTNTGQTDPLSPPAVYSKVGHMPFYLCPYAIGFCKFWCAKFLLSPERASPLKMGK